MLRPSRQPLGLPLIVAATVAASSVSLTIVSCGPSPSLVNGPGGEGNVPPILTITEPRADLTVGQGIPFLIRWTDSDPDNNATISFDLVSTQSSVIIPLVAGLAENDSVGPDTHTAGTSLIPVGVYNLRGTIDDDENPAVVTFASTGGASPQRLLVRIVPEGTVGSTVPPRLAVTEPGFDRSVTQDDVLNVTIAPPFANQAFDPDSDAIVYIVLDVDQDPNNDDPANPIPSQIIGPLAQSNIAIGATAPQTFPIRIDLSTVPPRPEGAPYFIRATADDGTNPRVHQYAVGAIHVTTLAAGLVDLAEVGRRISGTRWYGFNPGANLGSKAVGVGDFDGDGAEDFVLLARYGNPRNAGLLGEAYLVYGQSQVRLGGAISVNTVSESVPGALFEAPPIRDDVGIPGAARSDGITDVSALPDFTGDGRPELIFGLPHVHGAFDTMDFDPADQDVLSGAENLEIEVVLRQGEVTVQTGDEDPEVASTIFSAEDTTISAAQPTTPLGSSTGLSWQNDAGINRKWVLIKFTDVLDALPDDPFSIDIANVEARLRVRVVDVGGSAAVHEAFTDFTEQTTYATYAGGADPEPDVDYLGEALGQVQGNNVGFVTVNVEAIVQRLLDGLIEEDELRFIIVPQANQGEDEVQIRSGEFGNPDDRPSLTITYERTGGFGGFGCYPEESPQFVNLANNVSDSGSADRFDVQWYAGGMAVIINSTNRDRFPSGPGPFDRLEETVVSFEFVGQRFPFPLDAQGRNEAGGNIFPLADNSRAGDNIGTDEPETDRIAGARIIAGYFDFEDHRLLRQPAREGQFGRTVGSMGDVNNDGFGEIIISAPTNERYQEDLLTTFGLQSTHLSSTSFTGSVVVLPGQNYNSLAWRDIDDESGTCTVPMLDHFRQGPFGSCLPPPRPRHVWLPQGNFEVFAENVNDMLGGADSAGDFNQDGLDDIVCGAYLNDRPGLLDSGAVYILYSRNVLADFNLDDADDPIRRAPMLRIRGARRGDQLGWRQTSGRDVNGDRIEDVFLSSPRADFGGVLRTTCGADFNGDGAVTQADLSEASFNQCRAQFCNLSRLDDTCDLFGRDACKAFDYNNDNRLDEDDRCVLCCLSDGCEPDANCVYGRTPASCCENVVDNGIAAVVFGGRLVDGDRTITQLATSDLPGAIFYGGKALDRAGTDISSAGDFNQDGFGDILIAAPGETRRDSAGRLRVGVIYLIFGGTHLYNTVWDLSDPARGVGSVELPGIVFFSPYVEGRPNEAAPLSVGLLGDINNDGFDDIAIGNPKADFIDLSFPQGPEAPGSDAAAGRRRDAGDVYVIYGSNFGSNRGAP